MADMELFWGLIYTGVIALSAFSLGYIFGYLKGKENKEDE